MIRPLICLGLFVALLVASFVVPAHAAVGDLVVPSVYRIAIDGTYYTSIDTYCPALIVKNKWDGFTCSGSTVGGTTPDLLGQTWNIRVKTSPTASPALVASPTASAWCDPANYEGPGPYKAGDSKNYCRMTVALPPTCVSGKTATGVWVVVTDANGNAVSGPPVTGGSDGQCEIKLTNVQRCYKATDGRKYCVYDYSLTGAAKASSTSTPAPVTTPPADAGNTAGKVVTPPTPPDLQGKCIAGTVQAGFDADGIPMCYGTGSSPPSDTTSKVTTTAPTTTTNSDGSTVTVKAVTSTNSDGSTTTTTTTTTTSSTGAQTVDVKSTTSAVPGQPNVIGRADSAEQADLCSKNPNLTICKTSSVSGTCGAIACTGDAIQCATLRAAAAMECKQRQDDADLKASPLFTLGSSVVAGNDPIGSTLPTKANASVVTMPSTLDTSGWLSSGSVAFDDVSFSVQGHTMTLPLSKATGYLIVFRYALMIVALLVSFRMLSGVILRD